MRQKKQHKSTKNITRIILAIITLLILVIALFPMVWMFLTSIKSFKDAFAIPPKLVFEPTFSSYFNVLFQKKIHTYFFNSVLISGFSTLIALIVGIPGGYALSQFRFKSKKQLGFFILSVRIAPPIMSLFPLYMIFSRLRILGSHFSLIIMYIVFNLPLAVWVVQIFFREVPVELRESAIIDGCSEFTAFRKVMLPMVKSGISATAILCLIQTWNEYLFALVLSNRSSATLPIAITSYRTYQGVEWGPISAAGILVMLPMIIFGIIVQKDLVKGLTLGSIKG